MSNVSNLGAAPVKTLWTTHERSMAAYDQLPEDIRSALSEASYDMSAEFVIDLWHEKGVEFVLKEIRSSDPTSPIKKVKRERAWR